MRFLTSLLPDRSSRALAILTAVFSLICTQIPLFDYLGFEFSSLTALFVGYLSGLYVLLFSSQSDRGGFSLFRETIPSSLVFLLLPLIIISFNALFVKNCSFTEGLMFFGLIPVVGVVFTNALAVMVVGLVRRWRKTLYTLAFVALLLHIVIVTMTGPQIFAFNPILGYFPGFTYDESLGIGWRLFGYRGTTVIAAVVMILLGDFLYRRRTGTGPGRPVALWQTIGVLGGLLILAGVFVYSDRFGFSSSGSSIRSTLNGSHKTEHFEIIYPLEAVSSERIAEIADLHEFYHQQLARELRIHPNRRITSFLYATPEQKGRLIGAAGTNIAKPWLRQLHINLGSLGDVLKHELVHVMASDFGMPVVRVGVNSGLIEGLAVAVERVEYDETIHRLAAQIFGVGIEPDMESLFSLTGFLRAHGARSYVLSGSFCRYLIDRYGMQRFQRVYRTGSFEAFYEKGLPELLEEWREFIGRQEVSQHELAKAAYLFRRPSIFGKECARVIADLNKETREHLRSKRYEEALEGAERSEELTGSSEAVTLKATALFRLLRYDEAIQLIEAAFMDSTIAHTMLPLRLTLGDSYWAIGRRDEARREYERFFLRHLSPLWDEAAALRLAALKFPGGEELREFFLSEMDDTTRLQWLEGRRRHSATVLYLLGREHFTHGRYVDALKILTRLPLLDSGILEYLRFHRVARSYFEAGDYEKSKMYFWESLNFTSKQSHQIEAGEWIERCEWRKRGLRDDGR